MATKRELEIEVERLNEKYCKRGKNEFAISYAYGGYEVVLTGKRDKKVIIKKVHLALELHQLLMVMILQQILLIRYISQRVVIGCKAKLNIITK